MIDDANILFSALSTARAKQELVYVVRPAKREDDEKKFETAEEAAETGESDDVQQTGDSDQGNPDNDADTDQETKPLAQALLSAAARAGITIMRSPN
jgi:hypothetical protein